MCDLHLLFPSAKASDWDIVELRQGRFSCPCSRGPSAPREEYYPKEKIQRALLCGAGTQGSGAGEMEGLGTQSILAPGSTAALLCLRLALSLADCWKRIRLYSEWWTRSARRGALDTDPRSSLLLPMACSIDHTETHVKHSEAAVPCQKQMRYWWLLVACFEEKDIDTKGTVSLCCTGERFTHQCEWLQGEKKHMVHIDLPLQGYDVWEFQPRG